MMADPIVSTIQKCCNCRHLMFGASPYSSILAKDAITRSGLGAFRLISASRVVSAALYSVDMPRGLCGMWFCACPHVVYLPAVPRLFRFFTAEGRYELVGHGFDPIKLHRRTMQKMMAISNVLNARELTAFMVEEARASRLLDAAVLLPTILTGGSYVDCVEVMF